VKAFGRTLFVGLMLSLAAVLQLGGSSTLASTEPSPGLVLGVVLAAAMALRPGWAAVVGWAGAVLWGALAGAHSFATVLAFVLPAFAAPFISTLRDRLRFGQTLGLTLACSAGAHIIALALNPPRDGEFWLGAVISVLVASAVGAVMYPLMRGILSPEVD
jgi:hypothetical protein